MKLPPNLWESNLKTLRITGIVQGLGRHLATSFYVNAYYLLFSSGLAAVRGFFFWIAAARVYSHEDVGLASATISAVALLAGLADLGLGFGLLRFVPEAADRAALINSAFTQGLLVSASVGAVFLVGLHMWSPALLFLRENPLISAVFLLYLPLSTISVLGDRVFTALRQSRFGLIRQILIGCEILLVIVLPRTLGAAGLILATALGVGLSLSTIFFFLPRVERGYFPRPALNRQVLGRVLRYSVSNHVSFLLLSLPTWLLPLIVINKLGAQQNAYFYIAWSIGVTLAAIPSAISYSFFAEAAHNENKLFLFGSNALKMSLVLLLPAILILFIIGNRLLLLFGQKYSEEGFTLLRILALSAIPMSINQMYLTYKRLTREMTAVIIVSGVTSAIVIIASYALISRLGLMGPGVAFIAGQTVVALWLTATNFKRVWRSSRGSIRAV